MRSARQLANQQLQLQPWSSLRSLDSEIGSGGELQPARNLGRIVALKISDVRVAFERWQRDVTKHFFASALREQVFCKRETVIVAGDEADEHHRFGAIVEQAMQRFERTLAVVRQQVIA